jgi:hypothetical protein
MISGVVARLPCANTRQEALPSAASATGGDHFHHEGGNMKLNRLMVLALCVVSVSALGCSDKKNPVAPVTETFSATLNGANERPTARTTPATATATFTLTSDVLSWTIDMTNITNVSAAHIHIGGADVAGGVIQGLTASGLSNTRISGSIAKSAFVAPGAPNAALTWDEMIALMRTGGAYVNVHTSDPTKTTHNTGAGDFPAGEIRGQITKVS